MGGLITKVFTTRPNYISDLNRNKGDIGRLVTVGTPTQGSELAAYLADHVSQPLIPKPISELFGALTVGNLLERAGMTVNCGEPKCAIQSLRPGSSELAIAAGSNLASFGVRGLAPESSNVESALNALLATFSNTTIDGLLGSSHDTIVSLTSQNSSATSQINVEAVHAETPLNWLYGLGGMGVPVETTAEVSLDAINCHLYKKTCSTLGVVRTSYIGKDTVLSNQFLSLDLSTRVKIPQTALIFSPDLPDEIGVASTINTRVSTADGQVEGIYYTNGEFGLKFLTGQNLLGVDLTSEPLVKIYGIVLISGNKYATFSKNILRIPVGSPTAILSNADEISLSQGQRFPLEVIAVYGNKTLDVTDFVSISEAGNLIATQARDIVALNTGNGIIKIMFSGQEITMPINITPGLNIFYNGFE